MVQQLYNTDGTTLNFAWEMIGRGYPRVALDIGANIGNLTEGLLQLGAERVVSVEPIPDAFAQLKQAFANEPRVTPLKLAVSDEADIAHHGGVLRAQTVFNCWTLRAQGDTALESAPEYRSRPPFDATLSTVDRIVEMLGIEPNFIKIDVDGYEARVLRGAVQTIQKFQPAMMFEVSYLPKVFGDDCEQMIRQIIDAGYMIESLVDGSKYTDTASFMGVYPWHTSFDVMLWPAGHPGRPK